MILSVYSSCTSPEAGLTVMDANTDMQGVWRSANCGRITLWCSPKQEVGRPFITPNIARRYFRVLGGIQG